jgi:E3 ubiquitin-protein ligase TRIP12
VSESGSMTAQLNVSTYYGLIKLLATCAGGSASVAETLLTGGLPDSIRRLLRTSTLFSTSATSTSSVLRTNDQLLEVQLVVLPYPCKCVGRHCTTSEVK